MTISLFDLFKIGIGPSSSHTVGPMRAARDFLSRVINGEIRDVDGFKIELFGSLGATGIGHATDRAAVMGLMGFSPESVDSHAVADAVSAAFSDGTFQVPGLGRVEFQPERDIAFHLQALPYHPNALRLHALKDGRALLTRTYYSVGGGFVLDEDEAAGGGPTDARAQPPHPFATTQALLNLCKQHGLSIAQVMLANERTWATQEDIDAKLQDIWRAMQECVQAGMQAQGELPGGLRVRRRAQRLHQSMLGPPTQSHDHGLAAMDWLNLYALAVNEENAAGGRVVTAPTNGAAGIVPAVLHYYMQFNPQAQATDPARFLLTAAAIGILCKTNASISGAEVGCQGEVGSACAMAAAGLAEVMGGTPDQVENAAEIGLEHNLGLTCDPIGGLVQIPCIERNAIAAVKAVNAAQMALRQDGQHMVSLDQVIQTMRDTGRDMSHKYKETSLGGLAVSVVAC